MLFNFLTRIFGSKNERTLAGYRKILKNVNAFEASFVGLSSDELNDEITKLQQLLISPDCSKHQAKAFALIRECARRVLGTRHYDVQILGGLALCDGKVAEMGTGEGKTLTATLPTAYYALQRKKVFVVTVNDYLAHRDAAWMMPLYHVLGLTVGIVSADQTREQKKQAYDSDIIYVTNNELGFDYLRDRMVFEEHECLLPSFDFAIIDEVDSILIDEARTPLIISGPKDSDLTLYTTLNAIALKLVPALSEDQPETGDFTIDQKARQLYLSDRGHLRLEDLLQQAGLLADHHSLYQPTQAGLLHHALAALKAIHLFKKDHDYIIADDKVVIIDEHSGRASAGRRWSDGLHQAIEAKEGVTIYQENLTLASTTFQNFFKLFKKLSGMTGTADTEAYELHEIYGLDVVVIPPNKPSQRKDMPDLVFTSEDGKFTAVLAEIEKQHKTGRPVLVGTIAIEKSEHLSGLLKKKNIPHVVLNAKNHEQEADIVAQAGQKYAVTIATNMAGRGTDIVLGGTLKAFKAKPLDLSDEVAEQLWLEQQQEVKALGGLHILGSERHESRRIDNQLRGRSGRQGDPGSSQFFLSLDDFLMRALFDVKMVDFFKKWNDTPSVPIESSMLNRTIEKAQRKIEGYHFDIRKQRLEEDNVANDQRAVVYACRDEILTHAEPIDLLMRYVEEAMPLIAEPFVSSSQRSVWDLQGLRRFFLKEYHIELLEKDLEGKTLDTLLNFLGEQIIKSYKQRTENLDQSLLVRFERSLVLYYLDTLWREHLTHLELARQHVSLRGYAQKDPKQEYKLESFKLFEIFMGKFATSVISALMRAKFLNQTEVDEMESQQRQQPKIIELGGKKTMVIELAPNTSQKVARNDLCSCRSGKKYKHCCGKILTRGAIE
jgi:preprotein translocase subunit SecA